MSIDTGFLQACNFITQRIPFIIYKPDRVSYDTTIPYLSIRLNYKLVKIGIHDLGVRVLSNDALYIICEVLSNPINQHTILWVEDISVIVDKLDFINKVMELTRDNLNIHVVFTGIPQYCRDIDGIFPSLFWDTEYNLHGEYQATYIKPNTCITTLEAPSRLHFRVYHNIYKCILENFGNIPNDVLIIKDKKEAPINSILSVGLLNINARDLVSISTHLPYIKHCDLIECINYGWAKPTGSVVCF